MYVLYFEVVIDCIVVANKKKKLFENRVFLLRNVQTYEKKKNIPFLIKKAYSSLYLHFY